MLSFGSLFLCFLVKKVCLLSSVGFGRFLHLGGVVVFVSANAPAFCFCVVASVWVLREGDRFISLASTIYLFQFSISLCLD